MVLFTWHLETFYFDIYRFVRGAVKDCRINVNLVDFGFHSATRIRIDVYLVTRAKISS